LPLSMQPQMMADLTPPQPLIQPCWPRFARWKTTSNTRLRPRA
jgi:hypothetical protein